MSSNRGPRVAFLLSQLGGHAAARFGERVAEHDLTPAICGLLRLMSEQPGSSQHELAEQLGTQPSRIVSLVDELEQRGFVRRERDPIDRRRNTLQLAPAGRTMLRTIGRDARRHENELCAGLTAGERGELVTLLRKVADQQGLSPGVHPGYRALR